MKWDMKKSLVFIVIESYKWHMFQMWKPRLILLPGMLRRSSARMQMGWLWWNTCTLNNKGLHYRIQQSHPEGTWKVCLAGCLGQIVHLLCRGQHHSYGGHIWRCIAYLHFWIICRCYRRTDVLLTHPLMHLITSAIQVYCHNHPCWMMHYLHSIPDA